MRQRRRFRVCSRSDLGFLLEYSESVIGHPAPGASHPIDPVLLGQRFHLFGEGGDVGPVDHGYWMAYVTDLQALGYGFWVPKLRVVESGICGV